MGLFSSVIGAGASLAGGIMASRDAKKNRKMQRQFHRDQIDLSNRQLDFARGHYDFGRGVYDDYRQQFDPVLDALIADSMATDAPDYGLIAADTSQAFDTARLAEQRQLGRYGINPGDGAWGSNVRQNNLSKAMAEVMTREQARRSTNNERYAKLSQIYGIGSQLQGQGLSAMASGLAGTSAATGQAIGAMGQAAQTAGINAANAQGAANANWLNLGSAVGQIGDSLFSGGGRSAALGQAQGAINNAFGPLPFSPPQIGG